MILSCPIGRATNGSLAKNNVCTFYGNTNRCSTTTKPSVQQKMALTQQQAGMKGQQKLDNFRLRIPIRYCRSFTLSSTTGPCVCPACLSGVSLYYYNGPSTPQPQMKKKERRNVLCLVRGWSSVCWAPAKMKTLVVAAKMK